MKKKKIAELLKWSWMVLVIAAGIYYVIKNYQSSLDYLLSIRIAGLLLSVFLITLSRLLNVDLIRESVREVGWRSTFGDMFSLISITQLGKYIPGGIWQFAARFGAYKDNKLTIKEMGKAFFMENIWVVGGGILSGLCFLLLGNPDGLLAALGIHLSGQIKILLAILCLAVWLVSIFLFQTIFLKYTVRHAIPRTFRLVGSHGLMYFSMGISFFFLFSRWDTNRLLFTIGAYILSYVAGYVAIFAPGGIGVREVVSVALFTGIAPSTELAAITIVHRLLYTVVEFAMGFIGFIMSRRAVSAKAQIAIGEISEPK